MSIFSPPVIPSFFRAQNSSAPISEELTALPLRQKMRPEMPVTPNASLTLLPMPSQNAPRPRGLLGLPSLPASGLMGTASQDNETIVSALASGIRDLPEIMNIYEQLRARGPMMSYDPADLSSVTPMTAVAMLPEIRAARETERQKMQLERLKALQSLGKSKAGEKSDEVARNKAYGVISSVDDAISIVDEYGRFAAGLGSLSRFIPETPANLLDKSLDTIKAQIGFSELQAMRDASKTGGALGQVTERELQLLQITIAAIEPDLSPEDLCRNLNKVRRVMLAIAHGEQDPRTGEIRRISDSSVPSRATIKTYNPETGELE